MWKCDELYSTKITGLQNTGRKKNSNKSLKMGQDNLVGNEAIRIHQLIFLYCVETFKFYNTDNQNVSWKLFFKDWIYFKLSSFHVTMDTFLPIEIKKWYISYNFHEAKHIINNLSDIFLLVCSSLQWYWSVTIKSNKYHKSQQHYDIQFFFFFLQLLAWLFYPIF